MVMWRRNGIKGDARKLSSVPSYGLSWDQVGTKLGLSKDQVERLLSGMKDAVSAAEIRQLMGMSNASKFKKHYLDVLIEMGVVEMTQPDSPKSPKQKYYLTELGKTLLENE